ncbi:ParB/RepB/Spo0J family partition protein [Ralstonia pseudosolanacearum]|uniref:ParB/RepB/Spo0J family partition protein n=1 Tax=Ralstonia pseudosolanacearum TaxID=1310165 RepID=UPI001FF97E0A|nr:ParB/RepB/Spo0J family partition protein [Ralstonia pseudosolanacearum]
MATKIKKNFLQSLESGTARDQELRRGAADSRFDRVDTVLDGRSNLLQDQSTAPKAEQGVDEANFYVETLAREGKAKLSEVRIDLDLIDDNPLNSRKFYDGEKVKARAASIASHGQLVSAMVAPSQTKSGRFTLIDGHYRKRALPLIGEKQMLCKVIEGLTAIDFYKLARLLNTEREQETMLDTAFGFRQLIEQGIARTEEELIPIVGESKPKINKLLAITDLPQSVLDVILQTPDAFGYNIGYELTLYKKIVGEDKTVALAQRIGEHRLPFSKVEAIRKAAQGEKGRTRNTSRQYKIMRGGVHVGVIKEWDTGRVTLDMTFDDSEKRSKYVSNLKQQLELDNHTSEPAALNTPEGKDSLHNA